MSDIPRTREPAVAGGESVLGADRLKHLEFIQAIVARLGNSSFLMRGWTLTIVTALLALLTTRFQPWLAAAGLVPLTAFWFLDGYFLWQERLFRALYDDVITATSSVPLMSMDLRPYTQVRTWRDATFSRTLALFYVPLGLLNVALVAAAVIAP